jgi:site-specific recombinase XerD
LIPEAKVLFHVYEEQKGKTIFPVKSNQKINEYLKEIQILCGIDKDITFHMARHTFATTVTMMHL